MSPRNEWGSLLTLRSGCCRDRHRLDIARCCRLSHKPVKRRREMRSCGPSLASGSKAEDTDYGLPFCRTHADLSEHKVWLQPKRTRSSAPSAEWQSDFFFCRAALSGSCPSDTEGAKGEKVGHLVQGGKHLPALWSSGGNCGVAALFKMRRTWVTWPGVGEVGNWIPDQWCALSAQGIIYREPWTHVCIR